MSIHRNIFIGLGSNVGSRQTYLSEAISAMKTSEIYPTRKSSLYQSEPWGVPDQPAFLNQVIEVETKLEPRALLRALQAIERKLGRLSRPRWHEREIDLDILFYGDQIIDQPDLQIPHRFVGQRNFVLVPLQEIAPEFTNPKTGHTIEQMAISCTDQSSITPFNLI